jgi:RNA polymerase sigma-70 factor, ECF subfamily
MTASARIPILVHDSTPAPRRNTDAELVAACLAGDPAAERVLFDLHIDALHRVAFRLCGDPDTTEDIIQEAFVLAFARLAQYRGEAALRTWLIAILVSVAGKTMRRGRWLSDRTSELTDRIPQPAAVISDHELGTHLEAAIAALPPTLRVVVVMHDVEGFTHHEIGGALRIQPGSSKARLSRGRAKLRAALANHWKDRML